jgi:TPR repeat protein
MYRIGRGVTQDDAEAVRWYSLAAEQGHAAAQYHLGNMYVNGDGVTQDSVEGYLLYRLSADQGYAYALGPFFIGALFVTWLVSRGLLALTKNWRGGLRRLVSIHAASLAVTFLIAPYVTMYVVAQCFWLAIDSWRLRRRERREEH